MGLEPPAEPKPPLVIKVEIADEKLPLVFAAFKAKYPTPLDDKGKPKFTDEEWLAICIQDIIASQVKRNDDAVAVRVAQASVVKDPTIATVKIETVAGLPEAGNL